MAPPFYEVSDMLTEKLIQAGFERVIVLSGEECGCSEYGSVVIALWTYEAEKHPATEGAWIHPYYRESQKAYLAAREIVEDSEGLSLRDDIRVKPIFARLPGFSQGRNTLSYVDGVGSRFHVQLIASEAVLPATHHLETAAHPLQCGDCRRCLDACPTHAIDEDGFHRERCLRNWMMSGKPIPLDVRRMGNRLIGCDECQRCCPINPEPTGEAHAPVPLTDLLANPREACDGLREQIGANLSIPNRVLSQACLLAGCSGRSDLRELLLPLTEHPSEAVREHAAWAINQLNR